MRVVPTQSDKFHIFKSKETRTIKFDCLLNQPFISKCVQSYNISLRMRCTTHFKQTSKPTTGASNGVKATSDLLVFKILPHHVQRDVCDVFAMPQIKTSKTILCLDVG